MLSPSLKYIYSIKTIYLPRAQNDGYSCAQQHAIYFVRKFSKRISQENGKINSGL